MKILVTGNKGYIGTVLVEMLLQKSYEVIGYDTDYYKYCDLYEYTRPQKQITRDMRDISIEDLDGIDAVIHLAGLSNDPLGELSPELTDIINYKASVKLAKFAKKVSAKRFIYASSQSMYGISDADSELDEDNSEKNPITAYARAKWFVENELKKLDDDNFVTVCMRPSTVFGVSPRLRCDIVFNNLVACAYTTGKIEIKSDGTPWRPVVHVRDVSNAFIAALEAPASLVAGQSFNVGIQNGNYTVRDLAEAAQRAVPGSSLVFTGEHGNDARTYRVSFARILSVLKDYYKPEWDLDRGGRELVEFFRKIDFTEEKFRGRYTNRLKEINHLIAERKIDDNLRWGEPNGK
ncbi:MAG: NAD(P)-dependent oxidoreductase [Proteobacteria bacterium]|nr:NAD(P)-dependent oxidoreductase [Pseudomonadota bacterium]MBU4258598.1 NAD(P)-dependent oxidoreductase [Pseudomonadota bacterium]MBU4287664.1 NAD(P)-dependent oxidoreductase [Pseudomonadota bacterium]MBU4413547.1 NAD(P)-dependent oxidoreductase [Pseudomonadota bacterium]MCG2759552.1 NAD(P)-dependent oxidoreductase [Desulfobacteraceae bacterium]